MFIGPGAQFIRFFFEPVAPILAASSLHLQTCYGRRRGICSSNSRRSIQRALSSPRGASDRIGWTRIWRSNSSRPHWGQLRRVLPQLPPGSIHEHKASDRRWNVQLLPQISDVLTEAEQTAVRTNLAILQQRVRNAHWAAVDQSLITVSVGRLS